jgi:hypothetical protein
MSKLLTGIYRFLPVQLLLLHFRRYQLLLVFWLIVVTTITGQFASNFGASTLFLAPEYLGNINFASMSLLGGAMAVFVMAWNITTFIIHSQRIPFMGATRHSFLKFCINNSLIPLAFFIFYSTVSIRFQWINEHTPWRAILVYQLGFYLGFLFIILISFAYFFRMDRDLLKLVLSRITNPSRIREIIPYDSLDYDVDIIRAETYITGRFRIKRCADLEPYHPRLLNTVLRMHHRNAITATIFALLLLLLSGIFMDDPRWRIPAGGGFLILFSVIMGLVGAVKYFLRSWEIFGWLITFLLIGWLVQLRVFDMRSRAYGVNYDTPAEQKPIYDYEHIRSFFSDERYNNDKNAEEKRLNTWLQKRTKAGETKPPLIVLSISGGGTRAAYWTFKTLQYMDSVTHGKLFTNTVLISGASGGMIGASYWRELHDLYNEGKIKNVYDSKYQENVGKDLLNSIIFSFATVDLISPFNKISLAGHSYTKDRGYAMEQELIQNTEGLLDKKIGDYKEKEEAADIPQLIINGTIVNDGRKLIMSALPVSYLCRPAYTLNDSSALPPIDGIDFGQYFSGQNAYNLRLTTALRMNATFPFILPVVKLPSLPQINVMDAGLRDNFGLETTTRYLHVFRQWMEQNAGDIIFLQIRDTREYEVFRPSDMNTLGKMMSDPLFVIQDKWEAFESYYQEYIKDYSPYYLKNKMHFVSMTYIPQEKTKAAALNFHLTSKEKIDISESINNEANQKAVQQLLQLLQPQVPVGDGRMPLTAAE